MASRDPKGKERIAHRCLLPLVLRWPPNLVLLHLACYEYISAPRPSNQYDLQIQYTHNYTTLPHLSKWKPMLKTTTILIMDEHADLACITETWLEEIEGGKLKLTAFCTPIFLIQHQPRRCRKDIERRYRETRKSRLILSWIKRITTCTLLMRCGVIINL